MAQLLVRFIRWRFWRPLLIALLFVVLAGLGSGIGFLVACLQDLPSLVSIEPRPSETTLVFDRHGALVAELHGVENRKPVRIEDVPRQVLDAFLAIEDARFYGHHGFDLEAIARAAWAIATGGMFQGGSTITQQLAKNAFLTPSRQIKRKVQELIIAIELERQYTKDEIFEMYLNIIYFNHGAYGIQAASQVYFGKEVGELTLAEGALLAGITRWPEGYTPYRKPDSALGRRSLVLNRMLSLGMISQSQYDAAINAPLELAGEKEQDYPAPYFVDYVLKYLLKHYDRDLIYKGGLRVYTSLDPAIQKAAEESVAKILDPVFPLEPGKEQPECAAIVMDPHTGHIVAMVGGRSRTGKLELNRATQAYRQPGSAFKPIVVNTPALDLGYTTATVIDDRAFTWVQLDGTAWTPTNYDQRFRGLTIMRDAIARSANVYHTDLMLKIGPETGVSYAQRMGIESLVTKGRLNDVTPSLALGGITKGITPLELTRAYSVLANQGIKVDPIAVLRVEDKRGKILEENTPRREVVLSEQTAFLVTDLLRSAVDYGTGMRARLDRPVAGKTGTTNDDVDAWFVGYTADYVGAVWLGHDIPKSMVRVYGGMYPAIIWKHIMETAHKGLPVKQFPVPKNIVTGVNVCNKSGLLPGPLCPPANIVAEVFVRGTEPTLTCDVHKTVNVCGEHTDFLAGPGCPSTLEKVVIARKVPWEPWESEYRHPDGRRELRVFIPEDSVLEAPAAVCPNHNPPLSPSGE